MDTEASAACRHGQVVPIGSRLNHGNASQNGAVRRACISSSLEKLDAWIEKEEFRGWDPHDALNSPLLRWLTLGNRFAGILWLQLLRRSPLNLRPLLAIKKEYNPKGMGLFLASYIRKYRITRDPKHLEYASFLAKWLLANTAKGYGDASWGYNFDWPNRAFLAPAGTPTIVNTAFVALAFLDMQLLLKNELDWLNLVSDLPSVTLSNLGEHGVASSPLGVARSACDFVLHDLRAFSPRDDELCFSYTPLDSRLVHNANMMGAWLLASVYRLTGEPCLAAAALAASRYTARRQCSDGSWPYGEARNERWVDNFHTGFVLVALKRTADCLKTDEFDEHLRQGYQFWKERMFLEDGTPRYYAHATYPIDVHSVAQAVLTFLEFCDVDSEAVEQALCVCQWGVKKLQDPSGYFYYRLCRGYRIRIPYIRWAQAWMQRALTQVLCFFYDSKC